MPRRAHEPQPADTPSPTPGSLQPAPPPGAVSTSACVPVALLSFVSGCIALGYQVLWFRLYAGRFGSTSLTFLLVLVCFLGGLGLGSLFSERLAGLLSRLPGLRHPLALVGGVELLIAGTALLTLLDPLGGAGGATFPYHQDARGIWEPDLALQLRTAVAAALMLLPASLMGTTFPILCHAFRARSVFPSELYGANTCGAATGVLAAEFLLLPLCGQTWSFVLLVALNVLLGGAFLLLARSPRAAPAASLDEHRPVRRPGKEAVPAPPAPALAMPVALAAGALSGFVSGALEVDMFRAVRFAGAITDAAMSFTSFWAIVAIFLASFTVRALGRPRVRILQFALLGALVAYAIAWTGLHHVRGWFNDAYLSWVKANLARDPAVAEATVYPLSASLWVLLGFTGCIVFPAYFLASLLLPTVCNLVQGGRFHLGRLYGANTLAFCAGAFLFSQAFPRVSLFYAVKLLFVFLAVAAALAFAFRPGRRLSPWALGAAGLAATAGILLVPHGFDAGFFPRSELPSHRPVRAMKSNGTHTTYVVQGDDGDILYFDSHAMSATRPEAQRYMRLMAHVPLLAQRNPRRALLICFGVGNTAHAIATHATIDQLDVVDLDDQVFETADEFAATNGKVRHDPRVRLIHDDGRAFLNRTTASYDLITSEPPPPRAAGVYRLYSVEHYRSVRAHLTPEGMMSQWLPIGMLSRAAVSRMVRSFTDVFPHTLLFVGAGNELILVGGGKPLDAAMLEQRFGAQASVREDLARIGLREPLALLARIVRVDAGLRQDAEQARAISDERNDLALAVSDPFDAPRFQYDPRAVVLALDLDRLQCGTELAAVLYDPRRLQAVVPDLPRELVFGRR